MRNIELLTEIIDAAALAAVRTSRDKLLAFAGIKVDILEFTGVQLKIRVEQVENRNGFLLNQHQLTKRASSIFTPLNSRFKLHYVALTYAPDFDKIDSTWLKAQMELHGLSRNDVIKQMEIDKSTLSEMLSGNKALTKFHKAAFYYYFLTYQINKDLRESLTIE